MAKTCKSCKAVSESGEGYVESSFHTDVYCPRCYKKRAVAWGARTPIILLACIGALWLITFTKGKHHQPIWIFLNLYLMILIQYLVILPHELGHALSARLMGLKLFRVVVGIGPLLWRGTLMGGRFEIHRYPVGGYTISLDNRERGFKLRHWIHVACGPLVNALLVLAAFPFVPRPVRMSTLSEGWDPLKAFVAANLFILVTNLIPRKTQTQFGAMKTDGLRLVSSPFMSMEEQRQALAIWYYAPAGQALEERRNEEAIRLLSEGLRIYPEVRVMRHDLAVALLRVERYEEARREFLALLADPKFEARFRPLCQSNIAVTDLLLGQPELLEEADRLSGEAMATLAWNPNLQATRGAILIEQGRIDEGLAMALQALERMDEDRSKAAACTTLAVAYKRKGNEAEGRKFLDLAVKYGAEGARFRRVRDLFEFPMEHNNRSGGSL